MAEYKPYLLTQDEADLLYCYRQFIAAKRGSSSPSGGNDAGLPTVAAPAGVTIALQLIVQSLGHLTDQVDAAFSSISDRITHTEGTLKAMSMQLDTELATLGADVSANTSVIESAKTAFEGLSAHLAELEAQLAAAGATDAQVALVTTYRTQLEANTAALAAAIPANTPAATPPAPGDDSGGSTADPNAPVGQETAL